MPGMFKWMTIGLLALPVVAVDIAEDTVRAMIQQQLMRNPAWQRSMKDPVFSLKAPAGFVTDEKEKVRQRQAAVALQKQMQRAYGSGKKDFAIPKGEYRFADNQGLAFTDWKDFFIDAQGACFWFERPASQIAADPKGLQLRRCRNVRIRGLTIDFDPPVYIQAKITHVASDGSRIDAEIDPDWPQVAVGAGQFNIYTDKGEYVPQGTFRHEGAELTEGNKLQIKIIPSVIRDNLNSNLLAYTHGRGRIELGSLIALNYRRGCSVGVFDCEAITLEDVNVYQSPGMGILESGGTGGNVYRRMRLIRRPGTRRVHYGTADNFHSNRMLKGPQIIECEFGNTSDDNINLHGNWAYVWRQKTPTSVVIGAPDPPRTGNLLTIYDRVALTVKGEAKITAVAPLEDMALVKEIEQEKVQQERIAHRGKNQLYVVSLDQEVKAAPHQLADLHLDYCDGFRVQGCYFHDSRSRAMLLSGACNGIVSSNVWRNVMGGISVYEESWGYAEGPIPANITISHNLMIDCGDVVPDGGISVGLVPSGQGLRKTRVIRGIRIENNILVNPGILTVLYVDGGVVRNNILVEPLHYSRFKDEYEGTRSIYGQAGYFPRQRRGAISIWSSRNVVAEGNRVFWSGAKTGEVLIDVGEYTENVTVGSNSVVRLPGHEGMLEAGR